MNTQNFQSLIQALTGRDFIIKTEAEELQREAEYFIYRVLPASGRTVSFVWKTPKKQESFLRSFVTCFATRYKEPNPANYDGRYGGSIWAEMSDKEREFAYVHHASNMFSKKALLEQVEQNCNKEGMQQTFERYGFYPTHYGIGIFVFYGGNHVVKACESMAEFLKSKNIPINTELSDAKWVLRFKIGLEKTMHQAILNSFSNQ